MLEDPDESAYDATGMVGSPACGDMMRMWLKISKEDEKVKEMKWRTFGCGSAIAATSMFSVMVTENEGMALGEALKIKPQHIMERLGGLPNRKIHCSVLADKAFRKAANDYFRRTGQRDRIMIEGSKVIDPALNITDKDIEEAVLEGATDLEAVQRKLKVGVGSPELITEVEQLIRFYKEKYYG
jgi:NifU-like protein involved in Fe-S cluster formation